MSTAVGLYGVTDKSENFFTSREAQFPKQKKKVLILLFANSFLITVSYREIGTYSELAYTHSEFSFEFRLLCGFVHALLLPS